MDSGIYYETNLSANNIVTFLKNLLDIFELEHSELMLYVDIKNNNMGIPDFELKDLDQFKDIKIGKLSEKIFQKLLSEELIDENEINNLLDKEYSKRTFGVYYPILALNREDNKGNSSQIRYKSQPYTYNGKEYYLTREWFEENKGKLFQYVHDLIKKR